VALFLGVVAILAMHGLREIEGQTRAAAGKSLQTVLHTTEEAIHFWTQTRLKDAEALASSADIAQLTERILELPRQRESLAGSDALRRLRVKLNAEIQSLGYRGFYVMAPEYINLAATHDIDLGSKNLIAVQRPELAARVFAGEPVIVPTIALDRPSGDRAGGRGRDRATMFAVAPIRDASRAVIAAIAIRMDAVRDFSALTSLGRIGTSGETYAFNKQGYLVTESRFNEQLRKIGLIGYQQQSVLRVRIADPGGNMVKGYRPPTPADERPLTLMATNATQGGTGWSTSGYRDYRGVTVFGAWMWNKNLGIGLTTELDAEEAMQPYYFARRIILAGLGVTALLSVLLAGYLMFARAWALREIEEGNIALEIRATERTQDLMRINEKLQDQVEERIRAEEKLKHAHTQLEETNRKLEGMASTDGLTGIANRRAFDQHLKTEWNRSLRTKTPISLIMFDVDFFKPYNDTYGHQAGDECLQQISNVLRVDQHTRRPGDLVARYGGEEFGIVLGDTETEIAKATADQIRGDVAGLAIPHEATTVSDERIVTVSAGVATILPRPGLMPSALVEAADQALYAAKEQGRDRVVAAEVADGKTPPHLRPVPAGRPPEA